MKKLHLVAAAIGALMFALPPTTEARGMSQGQATPPGTVPERLPMNFTPVPVMHRESRSIPAGLPTDFTSPLQGKLPRATVKAAQSTSVPVYAVCLSSNQWPSYNGAVGVYKLPTDAAPTALEAEYVDNRLYANGGAVYADGYLYSTNYLVYDYSTILPVTYKYNTENWSLEGQVDGDISSMATAMAYDDLSGNIYGCFYSQMGTQMTFGVLNPEVGRSTMIKILPKAWNACAVSPEGVLYAIDMDGSLFTVDKSTGDMTPVGSTGLNPQYMSGATFNPYNGKLYYVCTSQIDHSDFYEINPATAQATLLYSLPGGEQVAGLFVPNLTSSVDAPAAATGLQAVFEGGSLSGQIKFTAPVTTFAGASLTGALEYAVSVDGIVKATGTTMAGAQASVDITVPAAGMHDFTVALSNDKGQGARARISAFVGTDTPPAVKNVTLTASDGNLVLTWEPITVGENGGYIDVANTTYTVVRYPEGVTVAEGLKAGTFTEPIPASDGVAAFYYTVSAVSGDKVTAPVESNRYVSGAFVPPYSEDFNYDSAGNPDVLNTYTIIDANNDRKTWAYYWMSGFSDGRMRCIYNTSQEMDDWLITPPVYLEANKQYEFSLNASSYNGTNTERYEVKYGKSPTVEGMTIQLIEPTEVTTPSTEQKVPANRFFIPTETGVYYFGIHGISDKNKFYLFVDDIAISAPKSIETPAAVTNLTVTPDRDGNLRASISCTAPTKTASGNTLTEITKIEISRDGQVLTTLNTGVFPGMNVAYVDETAETGMHTYSVVAYNSEGMGNPVTASAYVGLNVPGALLDAKLELTPTPGEVKLTWTPSDKDVDGNPINTALIHYQLWTTNASGEVFKLEEDVTDTEYYYQAVAPGEEQRFINFAIIPYTTAGAGRLYETNVVAAGEAYGMPFAESFAEHTATHALGMNNYDEEAYSSWGFYADNSFDDTTLSIAPRSMDGDNGFIGYTALAIGAHSGFRTGRIKVNSAASPVLTFGHFVSHAENTNVIDVVALLPDGTSQVVESFASNRNPAQVGKWETVTVPLSAFAGKEIMIEIDVTCTGYAREFFDNLRVFNMMDYNLHAKSIIAGSLQSLGKNKVFKVEIENYGTKDAEGYTVELLRDGQSAGSVAGPKLAPGEAAQVSFHQDFSVIDPETIVYSGVINFAGDGFPEDNRTPDFTVTVLKPDYPTATGLSAQLAEGGVQLTWDEPGEIYTSPVAMTEDFEGFDAWEYQDISPWTLYDGDGFVNASFEQFNMPFGTTPTAFFVLDSSDTNVIDPAYAPGFAAYSGTKMMSNLPSRGDEGSIVNDWLISPELTGQPQTVSFFARSYHQTYLETFEVLYSTEEEINPGDFVLLDRYSNIPFTWTQFTAELPRGARYFAIRCVSNNKYMFLVDNVTMITKNGPVDLARRVGYNIYRDGVKLNSETVTAPSYLEAGAADNGQSYFVTAVYDKGESVPSTAVKVGQTGIDAILSAAVKVSVEDNTIVVANAAGLRVSIHSVDGRTVASALPSDHTATVRATVAPGVYLVQAGRSVTKVTVR